MIFSLSDEDRNAYPCGVFGYLSESCVKPNLMPDACYEEIRKRYLADEDFKREVEAVDEDDESQLDRGIERMKKRWRCCICLEDESVSSLLLPCRHLVCCDECSKQTDKCPVCRSTILGRLSLRSDEEMSEE